MHATDMQPVQSLERVAIAGSRGVHVIGVVGSRRGRRHGASNGRAGNDHLASLDAPLRKRVCIVATASMPSRRRHEWAARTHPCRRCSEGRGFALRLFVVGQRPLREGITSAGVNR